jgi:hypothetical protein
MVIAMVTGMEVEPAIGQVIEPAVEILAAIICIVHREIRRAPELNLPQPISGRQLPGPRLGGPTTFLPIRKVTCTARQIRVGRSVPTRVGKQIKTKRPKPSNNSLKSARARCKRPNPNKPNSRERGNNRPSSLTAVTKPGNKATREPTAITSPAVVPAGVVAAEAVVVEVVAVEAEVAAVKD